MRILQLTLLLTIGTISSSLAQYVYSWHENYTTSTGWTSIDPSMVVANGRAEFNACAGSEPRRMYKAHGQDLGNSWVLQFEFRYSAVGQYGPGHLLASITNWAIDPISESTQQPYWPTHNDAVVAYFGSNKTNNPSTFKLRGGSKNDSGSWTWSDGITLLKDVTYTIVLERRDVTKGRISAYTGGSGPTGVLIATKCFDISSSIIAPLKYLQHGNATWGDAGRSLTGYVDNTSLRKLDCYYVDSRPDSPTENSGIMPDDISGSVSVEQNPSIEPKINNNNSTIFINQLSPNTNIELYNLEGKKVHNQIVSSNNINIDVSNFPRGTYFIKIIQQKTVSSKKVILK